MRHVYRFSGVLFVTSFASVILFTGCNGIENDLGEFCFMSSSDTSSLTFSILENSACAENLCLKQNGYKCINELESCSNDEDREKIQTYCTRRCSLSSECSGSDTDVNDCSKYVCAADTSPLGDNSCKCTCLDYIRDASGVPLSSEDFESSNASCQL